MIPTLNGLRFLDPPTETPLVNTVELWRLINLTPDTHPIHIHLVQFRLIDRRPFDVDQYINNSTLVFTGPPVYGFISCHHTHTHTHAAPLLILCKYQASPCQRGWAEGHNPGKPRRGHHNPGPI